MEFGGIGGVGPRAAATSLRQLASAHTSGLRDVLDRREPADGVAVDRRVADRELALVPGGEHQMTLGVRQRHQRRAAHPGLHVLLGDAGQAQRRARTRRPSARSGQRGSRRRSVRPGRRRRSASARRSTRWASTRRTRSRRRWRPRRGPRRPPSRCRRTCPARPTGSRSCARSRAARRRARPTPRPRRGSGGAPAAPTGSALLRTSARRWRRASGTRRTVRSALARHLRAVIGRGRPARRRPDTRPRRTAGRAATSPRRRRRPSNRRRRRVRPGRRRC